MSLRLMDLSLRNFGTCPLWSDSVSSLPGRALPVSEILDVIASHGSLLKGLALSGVSLIGESFLRVAGD